MNFNIKKMYSEFISLGFKPEQFYHESDINKEKLLTDYLQTNDTNFIRIAVEYLTLIAPGGSISKQANRHLKHKFRKKTKVDLKEILMRLTI